MGFDTWAVVPTRGRARVGFVRRTGKNRRELPKVRRAQLGAVTGQAIDYDQRLVMAAALEGGNDLALHREAPHAWIKSDDGVVFD